MTLFYIALGGAAGALARYGVGGWVQNRAGLGFPIGTLAVNMLGCLLIGLCLRYIETAQLAPEIRALVAVGILGAFTTFSTFSYETVAFLEDGAWARAGAYAFGSVILGVLALYVGMAMSAYLLSPKA